MVAFIVIGVHNWQTTAQGRPSAGSSTPASTSSHYRKRENCGDAGQAKEGWESQGRGEVGELQEASIVPPSFAPRMASWILAHRDTHAARFGFYTLVHTNTQAAANMVLSPQSFQLVVLWPRTLGVNTLRTLLCRTGRGRTREGKSTDEKKHLDCPRIRVKANCDP